MKITNVIIYNSPFTFLFKNYEFFLILEVNIFILFPIILAIFNLQDLILRNNSTIFLNFFIFCVIKFLIILSYMCYHFPWKIKYIVEYNSEDYKGTMTTREIVNAIYSQNYFQERKEKTSKVVIYVRGKDNNKLLKQILQMNKNTFNMKLDKKLKEQEEKEREKNDKVLDETHVVDINK